LSGLRSGSGSGGGTGKVYEQFSPQGSPAWIAGTLEPGTAQRQPAKPGEPSRAYGATAAQHRPSEPRHPAQGGNGATGPEKAAGKGRARRTNNRARRRGEGGGAEQTIPIPLQAQQGPIPAPAQPPTRAGQPSRRAGSRSARRAMLTLPQDQLGPAESGGEAGSGRPEDRAGLRMLHPETSRKEPAKHGGSWRSGGEAGAEPGE